MSEAVTAAASSSGRLAILEPETEKQPVIAVGDEVAERVPEVVGTNERQALVVNGPVFRFPGAHGGLPSVDVRAGS